MLNMGILSLHARIGVAGAAKKAVYRQKKTHST
jgi:hypothetical protein